MVELGADGRPTKPTIVNTLAFSKIRRIKDGKVLEAQLQAKQAAQGNGVGGSTLQPDVDAG